MVYASCTARQDGVDDRLMMMRESMYERECASIWLGGGPSLVGHHILTFLFVGPDLDFSGLWVFTPLEAIPFSLWSCN